MAELIRNLIITSSVMLAVLVVCSQTRSNLQTRILNGVDTEPHAWPWITYLFGPQTAHSSGFLCAGSLINDQWVLTAAHCLFRFGKWYPHYKVSDIRPIFDKHKYAFRKPDGHEIWTRADKYIQHPDFQKIDSGPNFAPSYDIALVRLSKKLDFKGKDSDLKPIILPSKSEDYQLKYVDCKAIGWGVTNFKSNSRKAGLVLQEVDVEVLSRQQCKHGYRNEGGFGDEKMCTDNVNGRNACHGDSGGPVQCRMMVDGVRKWVLIGVISGGLKCGPSLYPVVNTNVSSVLDWISDVIANESD